MEYQSSNYIKHTKTRGLKHIMIERFHSIMLLQLSNINPSRLLDIGCGEGFFIKRAQDAGFKNIYGFDGSDKAVRMARRLTGLTSSHIKKHDIYDSNSAVFDSTFDVVCCLEVLEHLSDPKKALENIRQINANYIFLSVPNEPFFCFGNIIVGKNILRLGNDPDHKQLWTGTRFKKFIIRILGDKYTVESLSPVIFPWTVIKCKRLN